MCDQCLTSICLSEAADAEIDISTLCFDGDLKEEGDDFKVEELEQTLVDFWQEQCRMRVYDLIIYTFEKMKLMLPEPKLDFSLKSRVVAGTCTHDTIRLNMRFLMENKEAYVKQTVGHEFAHYIIFHLIKTKVLKANVAPHGKEWKSTMHFLGLEPDIYHHYSLETSNSYSYQCSCSQHQISAIRHSRAQEKGVKYRCVKCKGAITWAPTSAERARWEAKLAQKQKKSSSQNTKTTKTTKTPQKAKPRLK